MAKEALMDRTLLTTSESLFHCTLQATHIACYSDLEDHGDASLNCGENEFSIKSSFVTNSIGADCVCSTDTGKWTSAKRWDMWR